MPLANILQPLENVEEWVLEHLHSVGLSWGLAIVGLTVLIRLCTLPLVVRQFRSQREMKLHMPELKKLQQKHKDDKQRLQREMAAYYKAHGINPLASIGAAADPDPDLHLALPAAAPRRQRAACSATAGFLFIPSLTEKPDRRRPRSR